MKTVQITRPTTAVFSGHITMPCRVGDIIEIDDAQAQVMVSEGRARFLDATPERAPKTAAVERAPETRSE